MRVLSKSTIELVERQRSRTCFKVNASASSRAFHTRSSITTIPAHEYVNIDSTAAGRLIEQCTGLQWADTSSAAPLRPLLFKGGQVDAWQPYAPLLLAETRNASGRDTCSCGCNRCGRLLN